MGRQERDAGGRRPSPPQGARSHQPSGQDTPHKLSGGQFCSPGSSATPEVTAGCSNSRRLPFPNTAASPCLPRNPLELRRVRLPVPLILLEPSLPLCSQSSCLSGDLWVLLPSTPQVRSHLLPLHLHSLWNFLPQHGMSRAVQYRDHKPHMSLRTLTMARATKELNF